ncbi:unnamed protein product [Brassica oleracea var. botrytis]
MLTTIEPEERLDAVIGADFPVTIIENTKLIHSHQLMEKKTISL